MTPAPESKHVSIKLNAKTITELDKLAKKADISRHKLMQNLIYEGAKEVEAFDNIGFLQIGIQIRNAMKSIKYLRPLVTAEDTSNEKPIPIKIDDDTYDRITRLAQKGELSNHQLMINLINIGVTELNIADKVGIVNLAVALRDAFDTVCKLGETALKAVESQNSMERR